MIRGRREVGQHGCASPTDIDHGHLTLGVLRAVAPTQFAPCVPERVASPLASLLRIAFFFNDSTLG